MRKFLTFAGLALGLAASMPVASAQQEQPGPQGAPPGAEQRPSFGRRGNRKHQRMGRRHERGMRGLGRLNLTDAQQNQIRSIREAAGQRTEAQRAELRQLFQARQGGGELTSEQQARARQLIEELRAANKSTHEEILGVLTVEQRAQLEQFRQEHKSRRHQMRQRRRPDNDQP